MRALRAGIVTAMVGPAAVVLYESGDLDLFRAMPLLNVWIVVGFGGLGSWLGLRAIRQGGVVVGGICLLSNVAVLALYGFLGTFFALGGSR